jgi:membrane associated rhomboid family serine protease
METRRMCPHCRAFITTRDKVCPYCDEPVAPPVQAREEGVRVLGGLIPHVRFNTAIILLINVGLFLATAMFSSHLGNPQSFWNIDTTTLRAFGSKWNLGLANGEWWRLLTAGFLHGGLLHIGMNMWVLFDLGAQVEEVYGSSRMLVIYFLSTIGGFYLSAIRSATDSVGASAALMGLMGAMIAFGIVNRSPMGAEIRGMYVRWVMIILVMGFVARLRTDNWAHIGGLATGFAVAYVAGTPRLAGGPVELFWRVASWLAIFLTGYSFLKMGLWFVAHTQ